MKNVRKLYMNKIIGIMSCVFVLTGCATGIPSVYSTKNLQEINYRDDKAYVYFYRPCLIWGAARGLTVLENQIKIGALNCSTYFIQEVDPGLHSYVANDWMRKDKVLNLNCEAEKRYYVKADLKIGIIDAVPSLTLMDDDAYLTIQKLKRISMKK